MQEAAAWHAWATQRARHGQFAHALEGFDQALKREANRAETHANRGMALHQMGRLTEALHSLDQALHLAPESAVVWNNRGIVLQDLDRPLEALESFDRAITLVPHYAKALKNRAITLRSLQRFGEALESYDRVLTFHPDDAIAWIYRGNTLRDLERPAEALRCYTEAARLRPEDPEPHHNASIVLRDLKRVNEALAACDEAITRQPDHADALWNKAELLILSGDYERGWSLFESRWRSPRYGKALRVLAAPRWTGRESLAGQTVLLTVDGGFGDTLNFCRYAPLLEEQGAQVILEVQRSLVPLLEASFPSIKVLANGEALPAFDLHCPMMSLPGVFALPLDQIPARLPYVRTPEAPRQTWAAKLGRPSKPRIGIAWSGSPDHSRDRYRSLPLAEFSPLLHPGFEFHALQKLIRDSDRPFLADLPIKVWENELTDFAETAALVGQMDLVISVDTSIAHLAGALGRPTWVLLPQAPDMRWLLDRTDSPWYPDVMRLWRQTDAQGWSSTLAAVRSALSQLLAARG